MERLKSSGGTNLPTNLEEFLEYSELTDWPAPISQQENQFQISSDKIINRKVIAAKLFQAAPLSLAGFGLLRKDTDSLERKVRELGSHFIVEKAVVPAEEPKKCFFAPPQTFLTEIAESEIVRSLAGGRKGDKSVGSTDEGDTNKYQLGEARCTNVMRAHFPGIRADAPTDLPNWLELPAIVEKVAQTLTIAPNFKSVWREIYLSQASIVLIQDSFWWVFLDYFKHMDKRTWTAYSMKEDEITVAKDKLFDRMADTYVTLFFSIDRSVRDKFLLDYPTIFMQSIFLCFADAFPDSQYMYNDTFKSYLADTVSLWLQGVKSIPGIYKKWAVNSMLKADQIEAERKQRQANMVFDPATLDTAIAQLDPIQKPPSQRKSVRVAIAAALLTKFPAAHTPGGASVLSSKPAKSRQSHPAAPKESLQIGAGAVMERVKYRLTGNSYLMDHHMRMHGVPVPPGPLAVRTQEVPSMPKNTKTYAELVAESQKAIRDLDKHLEQMEKKTQDEIARIRRSYAAEMHDRHESSKGGDNRQMDPGRAAALEVREMMKQAIKPEKPTRSGEDDEANFALGI